MVKPPKAEGLEIHYPERVPFAFIEIPLPVILFTEITRKHDFPQQKSSVLLVGLPKHPVRIQPENISKHPHESGGKSVKSLVGNCTKCMAYSSIILFQIHQQEIVVHALPETHTFIKQMMVYVNKLMKDIKGECRGSDSIVWG